MSGNSIVTVNSTIPEKSPHPTTLGNRIQIDFCNHRFAVASLSQQRPGRISNEAVPPKLNRLVIWIRASFSSTPICRRYKTTVGHGMTTRHDSPGIELTFGKPFNFEIIGMPANRGWVKMICAPVNAVRRAASGNH